MAGKKIRKPKVIQRPRADDNFGAPRPVEKPTKKAKPESMSDAISRGTALRGLI
jgi:hypothetical protein